MWIRKLPTEITSERQSKLLRNAGLIVLLWACLWSLLAGFHSLFGLPLQGATPGLISLAIVAAILPAIWLLNRRARQRRQNTLVCVRCNTVKVSDGQPTCKCGGQFLSLAEMKWIDPVSVRPSFPTKTGSQFLTPSAN